ncbi:hypothetical protein E5P55_00275 [Candidatus Pinguicoccus supinus]|uniref:Uncharacterized protein n=1 Tax=Candidatus Pinguicoccus supinus TaxID=2529394 RepID=A0A7T0BRT1_9BACT|nr:hypothetical protein E5P55_00275 [Candidatus Pinguicoccus supinus]
MISILITLKIFFLIDKTNYNVNYSRNYLRNKYV